MKKYNLQQAIEAKEQLVKLGLFKEEDFYYEEETPFMCQEYETGMLLGEPYIYCGEDNDVESAYNLYTSYLWANDEEAQEKYVDYMLNEIYKEIEESTREIAVRTYKDLIESNKLFDSPIVWSAWKRAFDIAEKEFKKEKDEK